MAGLNGAGKTTLARTLERDLPALRFSLDEWMLRLFTLHFDDPTYPERAAACRDLVWDLVGQAVHAETSVVLDWNMWSRDRRAEAVHRAADLGVRCHLHFIDVPLGVAIDRASAREDHHSHLLNPADVQHLSELFEVPAATEGFKLHVISMPEAAPNESSPEIA